MKADLIVCGSHDRSASARFLMGSVAAPVLRHATCSVEIVRPRKESSRTLRVLLATDGSDCSDAAAESVVQRPWPADTEIRVVSVPEVKLSAAQAFMEVPFIVAAIQSARETGLKRAQEAIVSSRKILSGMTAVISDSFPTSHDKPRTAILAEADRWRADLIVMGSHGRHGMDRFQLGSTSEAVALHSRCSVEVVRKRSAFL